MLAVLETNLCSQLTADVPQSFSNSCGSQLEINIPQSSSSTDGLQLTNQRSLVTSKSSSGSRVAFSKLTNQADTPQSSNNHDKNKPLLNILSLF